MRRGTYELNTNIKLYVRHVFVMDGAALPFTDTGKLDKRRLGAMLAERAAAEEKSQ